MAGRGEAWETQKQVFHPSPRPLEISPKAGEIPTFPQLRRRGGWKSGKPKAGFPLSHRLLFLSQRRKTRAGRAARPARLETQTDSSISKRKEQIPPQYGRPCRRFSGSSTIGNK